MTEYQPLRNLLLLREERRSEESVHGLVIPESALVDVRAVGTIVARGPDAYEAARPGRRAFFQPVAALARWSEGGETLVLLSDEDVFAVFYDGGEAYGSGGAGPCGGGPGAGG